MTTYIPIKLRAQIEQEAGHRCGYCLEDQETGQSVESNLPGFLNLAGLVVDFISCTFLIFKWLF